MSSVRRRGWRTWSLRRQLVLGVSAVVVTVLITVGTMSVLTLRSSVTGIVDTQLTAAADGFSQSVAKYRATPLPDGGGLPPADAVKPLHRVIGQAPGNIIVATRDGRVVDSAMFGDGEATDAPAEAVAELTEHAEQVGSAHNLWLSDLGKYRMTSRTSGPGEVLITAASLRQASAAATRETIIVAALTALALIVTAAGTLAIVRVALRPLGRVGDTLNQLLAHVERALTDVAASDRRMRQFITDASHELRTPLAAIGGYAELTRQDSSVLPETTEYSLARIEAEAARMNALVSDLLLLARLDEGQDLEKADVDLADLVVNAVNDVAVSAPAHRWTTAVPEEAAWVHGDRAKLHQAVANLLCNARDHTPAGTTVLARVVGGTAIRLEVRDDGPGIAPELQPHLFERFVRADRARSRDSGNSGLGLAIAQSIVEAHGGTITVTSGGGATSFTITLPAAEPARAYGEADLAMSGQ